MNDKEWFEKLVKYYMSFSNGSIIRWCVLGIMLYLYLATFLK